jgi:hypothetical protein
MSRRNPVRAAASRRALHKLFAADIAGHIAHTLELGYIVDSARQDDGTWVHEHTLRRVPADVADAGQNAVIEFVAAGSEAQR